jgi:hypothetical protein
MALSKIKALFLAGMFGGIVQMALPAHADFINGYELNSYCQSQDPADDMICVLYITGAFDAFTTTDLINQKTAQSAPAFCPDDNLSPDDLKQTTIEWLQRKDTDLEFAASLLVLGAIKNKYKCP